MKTVNALSLFSICLLFFACNVGLTKHNKTFNNESIEHDDPNLPPNAKQGKCYAQCIYADFYSSKTEQILEFTGVKYNATEVKINTVLQSPSTTRWEKGGIDPNCVSSNPEDCRIMCLIDVPATYKTYYEVKDSITNEKFKITDAQLNKLPETEGRSGWVEVLCEIDITNELINKLNKKLIDIGYLNENLLEDKQTINEGTVNALLSYQESQGLPIGGTLNIPTLEHLGLYTSSKN